MRLENCPVEKSENYRDCLITRVCISPNSHEEVKSVRCPIDWWVCPVCLPNYCPKITPENPNPTEGKVIWIEN